VSQPLKQTTDQVLMLRPAAFGFNPQTSGSNAFQRDRAQSPMQAADAARREFDGFVRQLRGEGIRVAVVEDEPEPPRPDAVFPNNWVSFHADGTLVLYPMLAENRRLERRTAVLDEVRRSTGFEARQVFDLTAFEGQGRFLEGTGSLVLDHGQRVAYAVPSPRTDPGLVRHWCERMGYEPELFAACDAHGQPYYHTNVVLSIGTRFAVVASEAVPSADRERLVARLAGTGRTIIEVDRVQAASFAANVLELATWDEALGDAAVLALSQRARAAFSVVQWQRLRACVDSVVVAPLEVIEQLGGGSARCMLAEVFVGP
jgi:hypothetical protein